MKDIESRVPKWKYRYAIVYFGLMYEFDLSLKEGVLLSIICGFSRRGQSCYISKNNLAQMMKVSKQSVITWAKELEKRGLIEDEGISDYKTRSLKPSKDVQEVLFKIKLEIERQHRSPPPPV